MHLETCILSNLDPTSDNKLYVQCLHLRRDIFIRCLGWNLYESYGCEFDEYDTPASLHVVALQEDQVVGCMRLLRTDSKLGTLTYMILDAHRGFIPNLPSAI